MYVIHKFKVPKIGEPFTLDGIDKIVNFGQQGSDYYVWATVNKDSVIPRKPRRLVVVGTGWDYDYNWEHAYTIITPSGFVWHLLKELRTSEHIFPLF